MTQRFAFMCVYLYVCVSVTHGLGASQRDGRQKTQGVSVGVSTPARPVLSTHCLVNGLLLFEGAVWSPDVCKVCECRNGGSLCHGESCLNSATLAFSPVVRQQKPVSGAKLKKMSAAQKNVNLPATPSPLKAKNIPSTSKKQVPPQPPPSAAPKKKPEAWLKLDWTPKVPPPTQSLPGGSPFDFDDSEDDDYVDDDGDSEDDDDGVLSNNNHGMSVFPDTVAVVPARKSKSSPTKRPPTMRTRQRFALSTGRSRGGRVGAMGRPVNRNLAHMPSLPAGCLLSESLIACGDMGLTSLPLIKDPGVRTLYLSDNKISKITMRVLQGMPNLEWLDLSKNKLDDASLGPGVFRNLTKLRRLNLDGNNLTKIPALPPLLLELKINDNRLSGLTPHSFKGLSQLLTLEMEDNHFHDGNVSPLAFKPLRKLIYLRLDDNDFRAIPSGLPASLKELHLSDNRIEVVHAGLLNKTVNLRVLNLSQNKLREDRIAPRAWIHLRKLETLDLSHNKLVHVPSFLPVGLQQLMLHHNQIERIPGYVFGHMKPGLSSIHLSYNRLREDGINEVSFLGLHQSLNELLLDHNQLRAIPRGIVQLRALQVLRLNHNYISSIPINALCDITAREDSPLISVHLQNNLIDRRSVPPTALTCIKQYSSVILHPQRHENVYE